MTLKSLEEWNIKQSSDRVVLKKVLEPYLLPELEIVVDDSLGFTVKVFGAYLVEDHPLYLKYLRTMRNVTVSSLQSNIKVCAGVQDAATELTSKLYHHVVPIEDSLDDGEDNQ